MNGRHNIHMFFYLSKLTNNFSMPGKKLASHHSGTNKTCHFPLFITGLVAKLLKSNNEMFHSKTSLLKERLGKMLCVSPFCSPGGLVVLNPVNCSPLCQSDVNQCVALYVCLSACLPFSIYSVSISMTTCLHSCPHISCGCGSQSFTLLDNINTKSEKWMYFVVNVVSLT